MLRKILLPTIFLILSFGFWIRPDFKTIAADPYLASKEVMQFQALTEACKWLRDDKVNIT